MSIIQRNNQFTVYIVGTKYNTCKVHYTSDLKDRIKTIHKYDYKTKEPFIAAFLTHIETERVAKALKELIQSETKTKTKSKQARKQQVNKISETIGALLTSACHPKWKSEWRQRSKPLLVINQDIELTDTFLQMIPKEDCEVVRAIIPIEHDSEEKIGGNDVKKDPIPEKGCSIYLLYGPLEKKQANTKKKIFEKETVLQYCETTKLRSVIDEENKKLPRNFYLSLTIDNLDEDVAGAMIKEINKKIEVPPITVTWNAAEKRIRTILFYVDRWQTTKQWNGHKEKRVVCIADWVQLKKEHKEFQNKLLEIKTVNYDTLEPALFERLTKTGTPNAEPALLNSAKRKIEEVTDTKETKEKEPHVAAKRHRYLEACF